MPSTQTRAGDDLEGRTIKTIEEMLEFCRGGRRGNPPIRRPSACASAQDMRVTETRPRDGRKDYDVRCRVGWLNAARLHRTLPAVEGTAAAVRPVVDSRDQA